MAQEGFYGFHNRLEYRAVVGKFKGSGSLACPRHLPGLEGLPKRALPIHISIGPNETVALEIVAALIAMCAVWGAVSLHFLDVPGAVAH